MPQFALTHLPTPVLNVPSFQNCFGGSSLPLDSQQLLRQVETILLPQSKVELLDKMPEPAVWHIHTKEYTSSEPLYVDERFLTLVDLEVTDRPHTLPSVPAILKSLKSQLGAEYVWGGNWPEGIPQLLEWYTPSIKDITLRNTWQLKGVDCSGLIYYASQGYTPRNTSSLVHFGHHVPIEGKEIDAIVEEMEELDLIVWAGHVICVLDPETAIESKAGSGVIATSLKQRLSQVMQDRRPLDHYHPIKPSFVIRRWHPDLTE